MLSKKLAVVTGAARGIGLAVAEQLAAAHCKVLMLARHAPSLEQAAQQLISRGHDVVTHCADLNDQETPHNLAQRLQSEFGRLDILVNNAGVFLDPKDPSQAELGSALHADASCLLDSFSNNTLAPLRLIQALMPLLRASDAGRIVNVSSGMGQLSTMGGNWPAYRLSKTALNALTRLLASELQDESIKINAVCPGWCRTEMGGTDALRSAAQGASGIVWAALLPEEGPSGGFFRDGQPLAW
ncbi:MAG: SDR family NAD(P)-dependent oxidoreductase [Pseudomonadota bacterium]